MTLDHNEEFYDDYWSRTEDQRIYGPVAKHTRRLIRRILEGLHFRTIVDVGCGEGSLLREMFPFRNDVTLTGTDISTSGLELAARHNPNIRFEQLDLSAAPLDETFDLVICSEVIEHIPDDAEAIRSLVAMTGRYLLVTTLGGRMRKHEEAIGHLRNYDVVKLCDAMEEGGLKVQKVFKWGWPFFSPLYRNLLEHLGNKTRDMTSGSYGPGRRILSRILYWAFCFNSWNKGDQLVILAERISSPPKLPKIEEVPFVSVVIPVRNEEAYIAQCIKSLAGLDYPKEKLEVIFADGQSTDCTVAIAKEAGLRVVDNPGQSISSGRNVGFAASKGDVVVFTDADCLFPSDWIRKAIRHFDGPVVGGVSGPTRVPEDQNIFGKAVGLMFRLASKIGASVHVDDLAKTLNVDDLPGCNAFYRREALERVMPTNTALFSNEDVEMNTNLRREGFVLRMAADAWLEHYKRPTPSRFCRQMRTFAVGRLQLGRRDRFFLKPGHLAVGIGVPVILLGIVVAGFVNPEILGAVICSSFMVLAGSFLVMAYKYGVELAWNMILALVCMLYGWLSGFIHEFLFPAEPRLSKDGQ